MLCGHNGQRDVLTLIIRFGVKNLTSSHRGLVSHRKVISLTGGFSDDRKEEMDAGRDPQSFGCASRSLRSE